MNCYRTVQSAQENTSNIVARHEKKNPINLSLWSLASLGEKEREPVTTPALSLASSLLLRLVSAARKQQGIFVRVTGMEEWCWQQ